MPYRWTTAGLLLMVGCAEPVVVDLVEPEAWGYVSLANDPFAALYEGQDCTYSGSWLDNGVVEMNTGECGFGTLTQPALASVRADEIVEAVIFHDTLLSDDPATGVSIVGLGDSAWWELAVAIPGAPDVYLNEVASGVDLEVGDPIYWHVHNHGANSWNLSHVRVESRRRAVRVLAR